MRVLVEIEIEEHFTRRLLQNSDPLAALQRRTLQLPGHVYLVSFVLLLIIIALLLTCHCYRMCRIAMRLRAATASHPELVEVLAAGPNDSRKTPQEIIDRLPVAKYSAVHAEWLAQHQGTPTSSHPSGSATTAACKEAAAAAEAGGRVCAVSDDFQRQTSAPLPQQSSGGLLSWLSWRPPPGGVTTTTTPGDTPLAGGPHPPPLTAGAASSTAGGEGVRQSHHARPGHARTMSVDGYLALVQRQQQQGAQQQQQQHLGEQEHLRQQAGLVSAAIELRGITSSTGKACQQHHEGCCCSSSSSSSIEGGSSPMRAAAANSHDRGGSSSTSASDDALPCTICLEEFVDSDDVKQLPCGHFYHCTCIEAWLVRDITCPLCKAPVVSQEALEQRAAAAAAALAAFQAGGGAATARLTSRELAGLAAEVMGLQAALDRALGPWRQREARRRQQQQQEEGASGAGDVEMPPAPAGTAGR